MRTFAKQKKTHLLNFIYTFYGFPFSCLNKIKQNNQKKKIYLTRKVVGINR